MSFIRSIAPACAAIALSAATAQAVPVTFVKLTGVTGGAPAETAVFKADLSGLGLAQILSIGIADSGSGVGGASGAFSGFDLDAVVLSTLDCGTAACAQGAATVGVLDYAGGFFTPGTQRPPADPKLFGSGPGGNTVDNTVATLGSFDANSTTGIGALGFMSLGDGGELIVNLLGPVPTTGLFLYIGEVGDNGEVADGSITVSDTPRGVPAPGTAILIASSLAALGLGRRRA